MRALIVFAVALGLLNGCDMPRDPEGTLDHVRGGTLHVGVFRGNDEALAADRAIVDTLAGMLNADADLQDGEAHHLVHRLKEGDLDLLIGGIPTNTPFAKEVGLSRAAGPLYRPAGKERVLAVRKGENGFLMKVNRAIAQTGEGTQ